MGGNSGGIIIQRVRALFDDPLVKGRVPSHLRAHLDTVLAKDEGDVSRADVRYLLHCLSEAHDGC